VNDFFALGVTAFFNIGYEYNGGLCSGVLATSVLFFGNSPLYIELGIGVGGITKYVNYTGRYYDSWVGSSSTREIVSYVFYDAFGFMMAPAIGMRFGRHTRGFFTNVFTSFPIVFGERSWSGYSGGPDGIVTTALRFGVGMGGAW
jgi:hypothetical protein